MKYFFLFLIYIGEQTYRGVVSGPVESSALNLPPSTTQTVPLKILNLHSRKYSSYGGQGQSELPEKFCGHVHF